MSIMPDVHRSFFYEYMVSASTHDVSRKPLGRLSFEVKKTLDQSSIAGSVFIKESNSSWQLGMNQGRGLTFSRITYVNSEMTIEMGSTTEITVLIPLVSRNEAFFIFAVKLTIVKFSPLFLGLSAPLSSEREISLRTDGLVSHRNMVDSINTSMRQVFSLISPAFSTHSLPVASSDGLTEHFPEMERSVHTQSPYIPPVEEKQVRLVPITYTISENNRNLGRLQLSSEKNEIGDLKERHQFQIQYRNEEWYLVIKRESEMTEALGVQEIQFEYYENNQLLWVFHDECPSANPKEEFVIPLYFSSGLAAPRLVLSTSSGESFPIPVEYIPVRTRATSEEKSAAEMLAGLQGSIEPKNKKHSISYLLDHG
ncbi:MAG: hypothetical protein HKM07_03145 [Chlamydiae bacterium]|nr:hypothetical protein [Chlamydiota bacterium]